MDEDGPTPLGQDAESSRGSAEHRRPIPVRTAAPSVAAARMLANAGVTPNAISVFGMIAAIGAGVCLALTGTTDLNYRVLFIAAALLIPLRLLCNMLDGMVAVEHGKQSATGELFNEVPDRVSDTAVLVGAGYAATSNVTLGWAAALLALFVTYIRVLGRGIRGVSDFSGPMAKQQRMVCVMAAALWIGCVPREWLFEVRIGRHELGVMALALAVVCLGCVFTAVRRLATLVRAVKAGERS